MLMCDQHNLPPYGNHPENRPYTDTVRPVYGGQEAIGQTTIPYGARPPDNQDALPQDKASRDIGMQYQKFSGPRSSIAFPRNYVPLPEYRQEMGKSQAYMRGAGYPLFLEWCGDVQHTRLQPTEFKSEGDAQEWRQGEWARQKGRRRFSNKNILEQAIGKRFATNESAQAAISQKQFKHPSSENRFYALLRGMSAAFGTLE